VEVEPANATIVYVYDCITSVYPHVEDRSFPLFKEVVQISAASQVCPFHFCVLEKSKDLVVASINAKQMIECTTSLLDFNLAA